MSILITSCQFLSILVNSCQFSSFITASNVMVVKITFSIFIFKVRVCWLSPNCLLWKSCKSRKGFFLYFTVAPWIISHFDYNWSKAERKEREWEKQKSKMIIQIHFMLDHLAILGLWHSCRNIQSKKKLQKAIQSNVLANSLALHFTFVILFWKSFFYRQNWQQRSIEKVY